MYDRSDSEYMSTAQMLCMENFDAFYLYLVRLLPKQSTAQLYVSLLKGYFRRYPTFTQANLDAFFLDKIKLGCKGSYMNRNRTAFLHYSSFTGIPVQMKRFKERQSLQTTMSDEEIEQFLSLPPPAGNSGVEKWKRWDMFWLIAAYSGIRPGNVSTMTINQVDFGQHVFILPDTKTDPVRIPINPLIEERVKAYIGATRGPFLFPLTSEKAPHKLHVEKPDWSNNFKVRTKMMGVSRIGLRPYSLRHSLCSRLVDLDINVFRVAQIMNHKNIQTTEGYYQKSMKQAQLTIQRDTLGKRNMPQEVIKQIKSYLLSLELNLDQFYLSIENNRIEVKIK